MDNILNGSFYRNSYIFYADGKVMTNTEIIYDGSINGERITTNSINRTDTFVLYSDSSYDTLLIRHIDP